MININNTALISFFKDFFLWKSGLQRKGEPQRGGDERISFPLLVQHPDHCSTLTMLDVEARSQELFQGLPHGWQGLKPVNPLPLVFPGHLQKLEQKSTWTHFHMRTL